MIFEPLTEKWHNRFGVERNGFGSFVYKLPQKFNFHISVIHSDEYVMLRQGDGHPMDDSIITIWNKDLTRRDMLVHEWQALYFSLCGEELLIKEYVKN